MLGFDALVFFPGLAFILWVMHKIAYASVREEFENIENLEEKALSQQQYSLSVSDELSQSLQLSNLKQNLWRRYYLVFVFQLILSALSVFLVIELGWAWWQ